MRRFCTMRTSPAIPAVLFAALAAMDACAAIQVTPLRQVLNESERSGSYEISNPSARTIDIEVSWIDLVPTERGYSPADAETRAQTSAAPFLVVSPTHFRLEPGERETLIVALRRGVDPPFGERRSHLKIATRAERSLIRRARGGVQLDLDMAISTPVILRGGSGRATASIRKTRLVREEDGSLALECDLDAEGRFSAYGSLSVAFTKDDKGRAREIARLDNIAVYAGSSPRRVTMPLHRKEFGHGTLTVRYDGAAEFAGEAFDFRAFSLRPPD